MGIPQGYKKVHGALFNRHGHLPFLESKPALKSIADPANLAAENPAIKKAAQIKQQEDLAPQKIKAIRYLAKIGCGCYDKDGSVTDALLKSLDDCTEEVRLATVRAIANVAQSERCEHCSQRNCCNEKITLKLAELAYERDETGCYLEPSERVRQAAIDALAVCCPGGYPFEPEYQEQIPEQIPDGGEQIPGSTPEQPPQPTPVDGDDEDRVTLRRSVASSSQLVSSRRTAPNNGRQQLIDSIFTMDRPTVVPDNRITLFVDRARERAMVQLPAGSQLPVGSQLRVYQSTDEGLSPLGFVQVYKSQPGAAAIRPMGNLKLSSIGPGVVVMPE